MPLTQTHSTDCLAFQDYLTEIRCTEKTFHLTSVNLSFQ